MSTTQINKDDLLPGAEPAAQNVARQSPISTAVRGMLSAMLFIALGLFILGPLIILCIWAFANSWFYPALLPQSWTFSWWQQILLNAYIGHSIILSFIFAPIVTLFSAAICLPAAYAFARGHFPGQRVFLISLLPPMPFPKWACTLLWPGSSTP